MKKVLFCLALVVHYTSHAQQLYNPQLDGNFLSAKIIFGDGVIQEMQMQYRSPEYFKNPQNRFKLAQSDGTGAYDHTGGIEAFMVDNWVWALRAIAGQQQFVAFIKQGAIEEFYGVVNGKMGALKDSEIPGAYLMAGKTKRYFRHALKNEIVEAPLTEAKVKEWIADSQEAVNDFSAAEAEANANKQANSGATAAPAPAKKGLMGALEKAKAMEDKAKNEEASTIDLGRIINNYNVWYEQQNPGKLKYYFSPTMSVIALPSKQKSQTESQKEKLERLYASRTSIVSPELTSAKDNVPVKKETFAAKIQRITNDGNKIGVLLELLPVRMSDQSAQIGTVVLNEKEAYLDESLRTAGDDLLKELQTTMGTDNIELINLNKIPYRNIKVLGTQTKIDDWWATKFKLVFKYTIDPRVNRESDKISLSIISTMVVMEFIGNTTSVKQDIHTQILDFGGFRGMDKIYDTNISDTKALYLLSQESLGKPVLERIKEERKRGVAKLSKRLME